MLNINKDKKGEALVYFLEGRLDTTTAPQLEGDIKESIEGVKSLVMDLAKLEYISSAGLRVLLSAQKTMNKQGSMVVRNVRDEVNEIFDVTGFSDILTIE
ncbi:MAG: STAS domain-containing protein [Lachnospiraceae bacterium]|nr:STAS domain-containing protein [Lachnospiraceae bacterium]